MGVGSGPWDHLLAQIADPWSSYTSRRFLSCFSASDDSLTHWRGYSGGSSGYALGFDGPALQKAANSSLKWEVLKCMYDGPSQRTLVQEALLNVRASYDAVSLLEVIAFPPVLKPQAFEAEDEWRLVSKFASESELTREFRPSKSTILPYAEFKVDGLFDLLRKIRVGPGPSIDLARRACEQLMRVHNLDVEVLTSDVPYRDW